MNKFARAACAAERAAVVNEEMKRRKTAAAEARLEVETRTASLPYAAHAVRRRQAGAGSRVVIEVQGGRTVQHKFCCEPDPARSRAVALRRYLR